MKDKKNKSLLAIEINKSNTISNNVWENRSHKTQSVQPTVCMNLIHGYNTSEFHTITPDIIQYSASWKETTNSYTICLLPKYMYYVWNYFWNANLIRVFVHILLLHSQLSFISATSVSPFMRMRKLKWIEWKQLFFLIEISWLHTSYYKTSASINTLKVVENEKPSDLVSINNYIYKYEIVSTSRV